MADYKVGEIVSRKSYGSDVLFKITNIKNTGSEPIYTLKGIAYRIEADAPHSDLIIQAETNIREYMRKCDYIADAKFRDMNRSLDIALNGLQHSKKEYLKRTSNDKSDSYSKPGKVLHIDGDPEYMDKCLKKYSELGIEAVGKYLPEKNQPTGVVELLQKNKPDILVLTGHDGMLKNSKDVNSIENYRNSRYYINSVIEARKFDKDLDNLIIFSGACQSLYPQILNAGANFCSSPYRILIHALDPVMVCHKIAYTKVDTVLMPIDVVNNTISGYKGIGGIQTRGKMRDVYPRDNPQS